MSVFIVGLSGVTNGGKSTLSQYLMKVLPIGTKLVKQDDYFFPEDSLLHLPSPGGISHHNWELISCIDMDHMVNDIKLILTNSDVTFKFPEKAAQSLYSPCRGVDFLETIDNNNAAADMLSSLQTCEKRRGIILIDGFTIYDDVRLREMCELKFFLTLPKDECVVRRQKRVYNPPDPSGYFDACVWPMYEAHYKRVKQYSNIHFFDGSDKIGKIFVSVLEKIVSASIMP